MLAPCLDRAQRGLVLTRLAAAGMTVLRNERALPLAPSATVALIGRHALETTCMGGGSAQVRAPHQISIADGLTSRLGTQVSMTDGVNVRSRPRAARPGFLVDPVTGASGVRMRAYSTTGALLDDAVKDENVALDGMDDAFEPLARVELRATVPGGAMRVGVLGIGEWSMRVGTHESTASLSATTNDVGEAVLRPLGWFTDVFLDGPTELVAEVVPTHSGGHGALGLIAEPTPSLDDEGINAAAVAAAAADIAVVVVGPPRSRRRKPSTRRR